MDDSGFRTLTPPAVPVTGTRIVIDACATPLGVRAALVRLRVCLASWGLDSADIGTAETVVGEVLNNIVEHAYADTDDACLQLIVDRGADGLVVQTVDQGLAMPGGRLPDPTETRLDVGRTDLPEGGFGWELIRQLTRDLDYQRRNGENHLRFRMRRGAVP